MTVYGYKSLFSKLVVRHLPSKESRRSAFILQVSWSPVPWFFCCYCGKWVLSSNSVLGLVSTSFPGCEVAGGWSGDWEGGEWYMRGEPLLCTVGREAVFWVRVFQGCLPRWEEGTSETVLSRAGVRGSRLGLGWGMVGLLVGGRGAVSAWWLSPGPWGQTGGHWRLGRVAGPAAVHGAWKGHLSELSHGKNLNWETFILSSTWAKTQKMVWP